MSAQYIYDESGLMVGVMYGMPKQPNGTFIEPPPHEEGVTFRFLSGEWKRPESDKRITRLAFINRFTMEEWVKIDTAAATVPTMKYFLTQVNAARYIDLAREDVKMGVHLLVANGMVTEARAVEILTAPILTVEQLDTVIGA